MGDNSKVKVDMIEMIKLKLATRYELELQDVLYVPLIRRNLLSISLLDKQGYEFCFGNRQVKLYYRDNIVGFRTLYGNLYKFDLFSIYLNSSFNAIVAPSFSTTSKCVRIDDKSCILWHKRLRHISRQRMEKLIKDVILPNLNLSNLSTCLKCMKGKLTSKVRKNKMPRCDNTLRINSY